ncbi:hypothetical protein ES703_84507 [subsurface metagenome]
MGTPGAVTVIPGATVIIGLNSMGCMGGASRRCLVPSGMSASTPPLKGKPTTNGGLVDSARGGSSRIASGKGGAVGISGGGKAWA